MGRLRATIARRYGLTQVAVVVLAFEAYQLLRRSLHPDWAAALSNAGRVERLEVVLHLSWERSLQRAFLALPVLVQVLDVFYLAGHFVLTGVFFVWLYRRRRAAFPLFRNGFLIATGAALAIHWGFPTAPPRLADVGVVDTLRQLSGIDIGSARASSYYDPVAAVPSLHAGYALGVGVGVALYARRRWVRACGAVYPGLVVLTTIVTGNHFVVDAIAGILVVCAGLALAWAAENRLLYSGPRRGVEQSGSSPGS